MRRFGSQSRDAELVFLISIASRGLACRHVFGASCPRQSINTLDHIIAWEIEHALSRADDVGDCLRTSSKP